jgi:sarcosine oxidase
VPRDFVGVFQPEGGILAAEAAVAALIRLATRAGADVRLGETVRAIESRRDAVRIATDQGTLEAATAIVAAGPWLKKLLANFPAPVTVTRQVLAWFEPFDLAIFARDCFPVFIVSGATGAFYGFPRGPRPGIKFAKHHHLNEEVDPDSPVPPPTAADEAVLRDALAAYLPAANGRLLEAKTCLYTMAPDGDFIIDRLPAAPQVIVASPCSGHGFKFAPVIGEILADLAAAGTTRHDISRFRLARFG